MFGTHGLDVFGMSGGDYNYPYPDILRALPHYKMKQLAGNSLNIPVTTAWVLYVLSNLVDLEAKMSLGPSISSCPAMHELEDSDEPPSPAGV